MAEREIGDDIGTDNPVPLTPEKLAEVKGILERIDGETRDEQLDRVLAEAKEGGFWLAIETPDGSHVNIYDPNGTLPPREILLEWVNHIETIQPQQAISDAMTLYLTAEGRLKRLLQLAKANVMGPSGLVDDFQETPRV